MNILIVPESEKEDINNLQIVICTYMTTEGEVDGITTDYKSQFPNFVEVTVIETDYWPDLQ